jgi:hypothetical protein
MTVQQRVTVFVTGTATQQGTLQVRVTAAHSVTVTTRFSVTISGQQTVLVTYCGPQPVAATGAGAAQQSPPRAAAQADAPSTKARIEAITESFISDLLTRVKPNLAEPERPGPEKTAKHFAARLPKVDIIVGHRYGQGPPNRTNAKYYANTLEWQYPSTCDIYIRRKM